MTLREFFFENFAGDLEYHPRRAVLYWGLAVAALCFWIFSPREAKFSTLPLVFVLGSVTLLLKGFFLLRKSSEGLGLTPSELADISDPSNHKTLPSVPNQAAQIVQDFGASSRAPVFLSGSILFFLGWFIRRLTSTPPGQQQK